MVFYLLANVIWKLKKRKAILVIDWSLLWGLGWNQLAINRISYKELLIKLRRNYV